MASLQNSEDTPLNSAQTDVAQSKPKSKSVKQNPKPQKLKDPIRRILRVNNKSYKFQQQMNDTLVKILQRYELDRPILMRDKLDIIWDKKPKEVAR